MDEKIWPNSSGNSKLRYHQQHQQPTDMEISNHRQQQHNQQPPPTTDSQCGFPMSAQLQSPSQFPISSGPSGECGSSAHGSQIHENVEAAISISGRCKIQKILEDVNTLKPIEKLLLYLKLPTEQSTKGDPLKQPLNPLGSRSEINQTIMWIKTHLEEDPDISLQKKAVYDDYQRYCDAKKVKPLSTADFGKVMKQVYPKVKPRRLGIRGQSQYCYSGLRKRVKLKTPMLPDLDQKNSNQLFQTELLSAAWTIVKKWCDDNFQQQFQSLQALAYFLITKFSTSSGSSAASLIAEAIQSQQNGDMVNSPYINKHKEANMQLQKKLKQKNEQKRKLQSPRLERHSSVRGKRGKYGLQEPLGSGSVSLPPSCSSSPVAHMHGKAIMLHGDGAGVIVGSVISSGAAPGDITAASSAAASVSNSPQYTPQELLSPICDNAPALPDFSSFRHGSGNVTPLPLTDAPQSIGKNSSGKTVVPLVSKLPVPEPDKKLQNQILHTRTANKPYKYKANPHQLICETGNIAIRHSTSLSATEDILNDTPEQLVEQQIKREPSIMLEEHEQNVLLSRERLNSISTVPKEDLDDYLCTPNSQEQPEEEIMGYFENNNEVMTSENKLSHLRQLLLHQQLQQQHYNQQLQQLPNTNNNHASGNYPNGTSSNDKHHQQHQYDARKDLLTNHSSGAVSAPSVVNTSDIIRARRAPNNNPDVVGSAELVEGASSSSSVPPSPNTRRKNFNFTPILPVGSRDSSGGSGGSPGPSSSKCSSTEASPFVSPHGTPVNMGRQAMLLGKTRKFKGGPLLLDSSAQVHPNNRQMSIVGMPMSAPASPKLKTEHYSTNNPNDMGGMLISACASNSSKPSAQVADDVMLAGHSHGDATTVYNRSHSVPVPNFSTAFSKNVAHCPPVSSSSSTSDGHLLMDTSVDSKQYIDINEYRPQQPASAGAVTLLSLSAAIAPDADALVATSSGSISASAVSRSLTRSLSIDVEGPNPFASVDLKLPPSRSVPNTPLPYHQYGGGRYFGYEPYEDIMGGRDDGKNGAQVMDDDGGAYGESSLADQLDFEMDRDDDSTAIFVDKDALGFNGTDDSLNWNDWTS